MSSQALNGFILHRRPYRETSVILDIFSLEWGKFSAVGKGVRGSKSDKKSLLQPFQALLLHVSGKHELKNLQQVEALSPSINLVGNGLFSAMYINELLNRLLANEMPHPLLFALYQQVLDGLAQNQPLEPLLRQFELSLLADLGYGIDFCHDGHSGEALQADTHYCYVAELGWIRQSGLVSRFAFTGEVLLQIDQLQWTPASLQCAKYISRLALAPLLGDKPLKSRELFQRNWSTHDASTLE